MARYSVLGNLRLMGWVLTRPRRLVATFPADVSVWHGVLPYLLYMAAFETTSFAAYSAGRWRAINPLPKLLPLPDAIYPLVQMAFGPVVKAAGVFIFVGCAIGLAQLLHASRLPARPLAIFYALVSYTLAIAAVAVDEIIVWAPLDPAARFALSNVHPLVVLAAMVYVTAYLRRCTGLSTGKAALIAVPSGILAGPLPGLLFR